MKTTTLLLLLLVLLHSEILTRNDGSKIKINENGTWTIVTDTLKVEDSRFKVIYPKEGRGSYIALKDGPVIVGNELAGNALLISLEKEGEDIFLDITIYGAEACILKNAKVTFYLRAGKKVDAKSVHGYDCEKRVIVKLSKNNNSTRALLGDTLRKIRIQTTAGYYDMLVSDVEANRLNGLLKDLSKV